MPSYLIGAGKDLEHVLEECARAKCARASWWDNCRVLGRCVNRVETTDDTALVEAQKEGRPPEVKLVKLITAASGSAINAPVCHLAEVKLANLVVAARSESTLYEKSDGKIAELIEREVWVHLNPSSSAALLLDQAIDRLRGAGRRQSHRDVNGSGDGSARRGRARKRS